jgi:hypothetical protein
MSNRQNRPRLQLTNAGVINEEIAVYHPAGSDKIPVSRPVMLVHARTHAQKNNYADASIVLTALLTRPWPQLGR